MSLDITLKPAISQESLNRFIQFEGMIPHFYLDGLANVTIGIGCMISDTGAASRLNMFSKSTNLSVQDFEIVNDFKAIKVSLPNKPISYYNDLTYLYLPDNEILNLFYFRISDISQSLKKHIPEFNSFPDKVKEVTLDMAFNLGISGLLIKFPKFIDLLRTKNFKMAAEESRRNNIQES